MFIENPDLFGPENRASLNLFLEYYDFTFAPKSNSWLSVRRRTPYLFVQINKIDNWSRDFFYLRRYEKLSALLDGIRTEWNFSPTFPSRREFSEEEEELLAHQIRVILTGYSFSNM